MNRASGCSADWVQLASVAFRLAVALVWFVGLRVGLVDEWFMVCLPGLRGLPFFVASHVPSLSYEAVILVVH